MLFVGIDLAWSEKNGSGISILKEENNKAVIISSEILYSDKEIIAYIKNKIKNQNAIISIDAPLIVPNEEGRRECEKIVGSLFRKYDAGAHPSNRKRLGSWSNGKIRGEEITKLLEKEGYKHDYTIEKNEQTRKFFEVYPHPSMVVLFNLTRILRYKAKPKRDYNFRWTEFIKYQNLLENLKPKMGIPKKFLTKDIKKLKGQNLKDYEDRLDSIFCAYIAYYCWCNPEKCLALGNMEKGYILTPVFDNMKKQLDSINSQKTIDQF